MSSKPFEQIVKNRNILIGSINSSRSDFEESINFMRDVIGKGESILDKMVEYWNIDQALSGKVIKNLGQTAPKDRTWAGGVKIVLKAADYK